MNKKLLAAAIAGAFVAPAAMADTSNVTVFGLVGVEAASVSTGTGDPLAGGTANAGKRTGRVNSSNNTELGFKGTEDLGNGMSAVWQIAVDVWVDGQTANPVGTTTTSFASTRNTFVGIESKQWGRITAGKNDTPYKTSTGSLDMFSNTLADYNALMGTKAWQGTASTASAGITVSNNGGSSNSASFDTRFSNMVMYSTPTFNGFTANAMWAAANEAYNQDQGSATRTKGSQYSLSAVYSNGPIYATIAHEQQRIQNAVNEASAAPKDKALKLGFGYNFGATKVGVIWEKISDDRTQAAVASTFGGTSNQLTTNVNSRSIEHKAWYIGASHTMGKAVLKAAYTHMGDLDGTSDTGAKQWSAGVDYNLSKRTKVYALYTKLSNERLGAYSLGQGGLQIATNAGGSAVVGGADPSGFAVGMQHSF